MRNDEDRTGPSRTPGRKPFRKLALGVLLLSFVPDLLLLGAPPPMEADVVQAILLMMTHVVAAGVCVWLLEHLLRA